MKDIKFKVYIQEQSSGIHPLEIDIRAGKLWDVVSINF